MKAAVALILAPERDPSILLIQRAERVGDHWSGHMALPGGRREPSDADLLDTAIRETREETGVRLTREDLVRPLDELGPRSSGAPKMVVRPYVFRLKEQPAVTPSEEVAGHLWVKVSTLRAHGAGKELHVAQAGRPVRCFELEGRIVWGLTHRILEQFLYLTPLTL